MSNEQAKWLMEIRATLELSKTKWIGSSWVNVERLLTFIDEQRGEIEKLNNTLVEKFEKTKEVIEILEFKVTNLTTEKGVANAEIDRLKKEIEWRLSHAGILRAQEEHNKMMAEKDATIERLQEANRDMDLSISIGRIHLQVLLEAANHKPGCKFGPCTCGKATKHSNAQIEANKYMRAQNG